VTDFLPRFRLLSIKEGIQEDRAEAKFKNYITRNYVIYVLYLILFT
jgi:hypothetical protein